MVQAAEIGRLGAVAVALEHELAAVKLRYQLQVSCQSCNSFIASTVTLSLDLLPC